MHQSAYKAMRRAINRFMPDDRPLTVVDFGSGTNRARFDGGMTHAALFEGHDVRIIGVDVVPRLNVDVVMPKPYKVPLKSGASMWSCPGRCSSTSLFREHRRSR